jgi:hemerythrin HHE cation binding domain-containing protein
MGTDIATLLRRDHEDLDRGLAALLDPTAAIGQIRTTIDGVRLGLTAHAEAEDIVFHAAIQNCSSARVLELVVEEAAQAHRVQEVALAALVCAPLGSAAWYDNATWLRELVKEHASYEEQCVLPAIHELAPEIYPRLAARFATERLRQLSMLAPSAPIYVPELVRSLAQRRATG